MTNNTENNYTETDLGNISLNPRGEYDPSAVYEYLDTVSYQGGSYFCLAELETTITGIAPDPGHNSEHWQMIALPGGMTQEYITAHDDVINKANQVETSRVAVELAQQEVEAAQTDMQQLHSDTVQAAQEAENSKDSAANYAQSAEQSRNAASESEQNVNAQITKVETDVKKVANDRLAVEAAAKNVSDNTQSVVSNAKNAKTAAENAAQSAKSVEDASKQIEQNKKDVDSLKWGLSTKITKFYKSNQGETHITDSDNGKIMDMMLYGKSSQDGTPTPENPVEIKSVVNPTIKVCGKNLLQPNLRYSDEIKINLKKGLTLTMISKNGTNAKGGNLMFTLVDGEQYWLGFDTGSEKHQITLIKDSISATYYFTEESSENYALYIGDESAYEPYKEQSIQLPITLNAIPVHSGGNVTIDGQQYIADYVDVERGKVVRRVDSSKLDNTQSIIDKNEWLLAEPQEIDLTQEEVQTLKTLATYYPTTNISINSEQLDGYTVFNYPTPFEDEWNKTQKEIGGLKAETGSLKENLDNMHEDLYVKTYNIFDVNFLPRAFISLASSHAGELFLDNNDNYSATNETINVLPNTQYTFSNGSESIPYELQLSVIFYDKDMMFLGYVSNTINKSSKYFEFTTIDNTNHLRFQLRSTGKGSDIPNIKKWQLNEGNLLPYLDNYVLNCSTDNIGNELTDINIDNPQVRDFVEDVDYTNQEYTITQVGTYSAPSVYYRKDCGFPMVVKWKLNRDIKNQILYISTNKLIPIADTVTVKSYDIPCGINNFAVYNLIPNATYYYKVCGTDFDNNLIIIKEGRFTTIGQVHMLKIDGLKNVRDLGGWLTPNGKIKYGLLFRGCELDDTGGGVELTHEGKKELFNRIRIKTDIDLRTDVGNTKSPIGALVDYNCYPIQPYDTGLKDTITKGLLKSIFEKIEEKLSKSNAIYFHCQGGRDRTGTLAFLILGVLGVSESDIAKDYELTEFAYASYKADNPNTSRKFAQYAAMVSYIKTFNGVTFNDKIISYLLSIGISQATINNIKSYMVAIEE